MHTCKKVVFNLPPPMDNNGHQRCKNWLTQGTRQQRIATANKRAFMLVKCLSMVHGKGCAEDEASAKQTQESRCLCNINLFSY